MKINVAVIVLVLAVLIGILVAYPGEESSGGDIHKCSTSTNFRDIFCKKGE